MIFTTNFILTVGTFLWIPCIEGSLKGVQEFFSSGIHTNISKGNNLNLTLCCLTWGIKLKIRGKDPFSTMKKKNSKMDETKIQKSKFNIISRPRLLLKFHNFRTFL